MAFDADALRRAVDAGQERLWREQAVQRAAHPGAAVFIPLMPRADGGCDILFEVRALHLERQPGEVCLPGGHVEAGEDGIRAAVRETCEELLVSEGQIRVIGMLDSDRGPKDLPLQVCYGLLQDYAGTWSADEVERTFSVPLRWFLEHDPVVYSGRQEPVFDDDFPWDAIPGGRSYPWRAPKREVTFYFGTDPLIWGMTAREVHRFVEALKRGGLNCDS